MSEITLTNQSSAYLEKLVADGRRDSYVKTTRRHLNHFMNFAEKKPLTKTLVREWALSLNEKSLSVSETMNYIYSVNGLLEWLNHSEFQLNKHRDYMFDDDRKLYLLDKDPYNLTGMRFGRLVAIKSIRDENGIKKWLCKCDCGNETFVTTGHLKSGKSVSCGCVNKEKSHDLTGKRFGKLTVLKKSDQKINRSLTWECLCDCGNKCLKPANELISGFAKSCGCVWRASAVVAGQKYGRLTAIEPIEKRSSSRAVYWHCVCDCGKEIDVEARSLVSGHTTSCGCWFRQSNAEKIQTVLTYVDSTCLEFLENIGKVRPTTSPDTGVRGVTMQKDGKYQAIIFFRKQRYYLGRYEKLDDAVSIRKAAEVLVEECLEDYKNGIPFPDRLPVEKIYK